jgi:hypothetical protein
MTDATTWHGRRGSVVLGPTENRVARWLESMTRHGRVTIRTSELASATHVQRSEAYRITARLRVLGLFGIENDRGGGNHGRRYWRTAIEHDGAALPPVAHRQAWSRIVAWARSRRERTRTRLAALRANHTRAGVDRLHAGDPAPTPPGGRHLPSGGVTFAGQLRRFGAGALLDGWGVQ